METSIDYYTQERQTRHWKKWAKTYTVHGTHVKHKKQRTNTYEANSQKENNNRENTQVCMEWVSDIGDRQRAENSNFCIL